MGQIDKVVELDLGCVPEAAISGGVLVQTDYSTFLTFNAQRIMGQRSERVGFALVEFPRCIITQFGYPNDEARVGHPLRSSGLGEYSYGIFEVLNPSWVKRIDQQNRIKFPKWDSYAARHFMITFHDSTFECLAADIHLEIINEPYEHIFERIARRVVSE